MPEVFHIGCWLRFIMKDIFLDSLMIKVTELWSLKLIVEVIKLP
jgi:hypothetical protein